VVRCRHGRGQRQFRRVNGHLHLAKLVAELERVTAETVGANQHNETVQAA